VKAAIKIAVCAALAVAVLLGAWYGIRSAGQKLLENGLETTEENLRRGAVACYALEGSYPESLEYLEEHYGVTVDESRYTVYYSVFASNIMPDITVAIK
jgi:hypothetical protein